MSVTSSQPSGKGGAASEILLGRWLNQPWLQLGLRRSELAEKEWGAFPPLHLPQGCQTPESPGLVGTEHLQAVGLPHSSLLGPSHLRYEVISFQSWPGNIISQCHASTCQIHKPD